MDYSRLFEPFSIGRLDIKNRIVLAPMGTTGLCTSEGGFNERGVEYFTERARGGAGLLITGTAKIENDIERFALPSQPNPRLNPAHFRLGATEMTERVHLYDCRIFLQLTFGFGRVAKPALVGRRPVAPSPVPNYWDPDVMCRELTTEEVEIMIENFGEAARIARECGFDGIEVHAVHEGYLLDQFTMKLFNRRADRFGGPALRDRLTLPIELLASIRRQAGADYPVSLRYSIRHFIKNIRVGALPGEDFEEMGRTLGEGLEAARIFQETGYDAFNADGGSYDAWFWAHPPMYMKDGCYLDMTRELRKVVGIPVITAGKLGSPDMALHALESGAADAVGLGRPLLTDPEWPEKVKAGRARAIRPCIGCHDACLNRIANGKTLSCAVNPQVGREAIYGISPAESPKTVLVVGGGLAGMETARVAALRGHRVILCEKSDSLGGHVLAGSRPQFKDGDRCLLEWYRDALRDVPVEVRMNTEVTDALVLSENPDVLVVATGSAPYVPPIPGVDMKSVKVGTAVDVLLSRKVPGRRVTVIGGGLVGCELAYWLRGDGRDVSVVEALGEPMKLGDIAHPNRLMMLRLLEQNDIPVYCLTKVREVRPEGVLLEGPAGERVLESDFVVLATGYRPADGLYRRTYGIRPHVHLIGDARKVGNIREAIWNGYELGRSI